MKRFFILIFLLVVLDGQAQIMSVRQIKVRNHYEPEALAFINATGITDQNQKEAVNQLVRDLKAINAIQPDFINFSNPSLSRTKAIYPFVGGTPYRHMFNLVDPRNADNAYRLTFTGPVIHDTNGIKGTGNSWANTHLVPEEVLSVSDFHLSFYSPENNATPGKGIIGAESERNISWRTEYFYNGADNMIPVMEHREDGFYIFQRDSSEHASYFKNGFLRISANSVSSGEMPDVPFLILGIQGSYSTRRCSFASFGGGMSEQVALAYTHAVNRFQSMLGRNCIYSIPPVTVEPASGARIKRFVPGWGNDIYYTIQFPRRYDPDPEVKYPVIISYPGNEYQELNGFPDEARLGCGYAGDMPVIVVVAPFLNSGGTAMQPNWWGTGMDDISSSLNFTNDMLDDLIGNFPVDSSKIICAGFSRGAIAVGKIFCSNDQIASRFLGFMAHSWMDGAAFTPEGAAERIGRTQGKSWCISWGGGPGDVSGKQGSQEGLAIVQSAGISEVHYEVPLIDHNTSFALFKNEETIQNIREYIRNLFGLPAGN